MRLSWKLSSHLLHISLFFFIVLISDDWILNGFESYDEQFQLSEKIIFAKLFGTTLILISWLVIEYKILSKLIDALFFPYNRSILFYSIPLLAFLLLLANWFPVMLDEANSYLFFVERGFGATSAYYPSPNNHVLFNLLAGFIHKVGLNSVLSLRVISIISVVVTSFYLYQIVLHFFSRKVALFSVFGWLFFYHSIVYGFLGRGYSLEVLFLVLSVVHLEKYYRLQHIGDQYAYLFFSILGFFTLPTFLFYYVPVSIFWLYVDRSFKKWFFLQIVVVIGFILCYFPVFLFSGIDSLLQNGWVSPSLNFWQNFFIDFEGFFTFQWLYSGGVYISIFLLGVYYKLGNYKKKVLSVIGLSYVSLIIICFIIQRFPPYRVLHFYTFFNFLLIAILIEHISKQTVIVLLVTLIAGWSLFTIYDFRSNGMKQYDDLDKVRSLLSRYEIHELSVDDDFYYVMLKYYEKDRLKIHFNKTCKGYFLSSTKKVDAIGETEFTSLQYCK